MIRTQLANRSLYPQKIRKKVIFLAALVVQLMQAGSINAVEPSEKSRPAQISQSVVRGGIAVEMSIKSASTGSKDSDALMEGGDASFRFVIRDTAAKNPLTGLRPAAWLDLHKGKDPTSADECKKNIQAFVGGSLGARSESDLNSYYVLGLNNDATVTVVDPLFGYGGSKLLALVNLKAPGEDWVLSRDQRRLFVSIPAANEVAVIDTATWKIVQNIEAGTNPTRLALQGDGRYLWVSSDKVERGKPAGGTTVIDTDSLKVVARIATGAGPHEIAFGKDDRWAFIANKTAGTVSVVDVRKLAKVKDIKTGRLPTSVAYSTSSGALFVPHEGEGTVAVIDAESHKVLKQIKAEPGLGVIRFAPNGKLGFVVNLQRHLVHIIDASTNQIVQTADVAEVLGKRPFEVTFTKFQAYIRSLDSEHILMAPLDLLGTNKPVHLVDFPGGQTPVGKALRLSRADTIVPAPEATAVLVASPADRMIYYYREGMAAPMGSFQNYGREPRAVLVVDRSLRETEPGVYATNVRLTKSGTYDVAFLVDTPRVIHCFEVNVAANPAVKKMAGPSIKIEPLFKEKEIRVGETIELRVKVVDAATNQPKTDLKDVGVLTFLAPGTGQQRMWAESVGEGIYKVSFTAPQPGAYYVFFQVPSLKVRYNQLPHQVLQAVGETTAARGVSNR